MLESSSTASYVHWQEAGLAAIVGLLNPGHFAMGRRYFMLGLNFPTTMPACIFALMLMSKSKWNNKTNQNGTTTTVLILDSLNWLFTLNAQKRFAHIFVLFTVCRTDLQV